MVVMAEEFDCSIITASQTNREALGKERITIKDFSEAFSKAMIADTIIALSETDEERSMGVMRLFMAKVRNEDDGMNEIECRVFKNLMRIVSASEYARQIAGEDDEL
jgi:hypothetical protein